MSPVFEVPVFSAAAAKIAIDHGASRLELNRAGSYADGGLTPTPAEVEATISALATSAAPLVPLAPLVSLVPLRIMIRPRGPPADGSPDFLYSDAEFRQMHDDLCAFVASGALSATRGDGFVFGVLAKTGSGSGTAMRIDAERNRKLVLAAGAYACVFHRAFDLVVGERPDAALASLRDLGFTGVLTAGGAGARGAVDHVDTLRQLATEDANMEIIVGGGVRSQNLGKLAEGILPKEQPRRHSDSGSVSFHSSCIADAAAAVRNGAESEVVDGAEVLRISTALSSLV